MQEGQQQQRDGAAVQLDASGSQGVDVHEAGLAAADLAADPRLVLRHSGVDSRPVGLSAARTEAHHATLDPLGAVLIDQRAPGVTLEPQAR